jgi:hypothetical protein
VSRLRHDHEPANGAACAVVQRTRRTPCPDETHVTVALRTAWEHFAHGADIGIRGIGPTKEAAFQAGLSKKRATRAARVCQRMMGKEGAYLMRREQERPGG